MRVRGYRETTNDAVSFAGWRVPDGGTPQNIAPIQTHSTTGWQTLEYGVDHTTEDDEIYFAVIILNPDAAADDARVQYMELEYTVGSYARTY